MAKMKHARAARLLALVLTLRALPLRAEAGLIPLKLPSGKVLQAEVMDTPELRALGVMFRPSLPEDRGLLFVFERLDFYSFWMKNCRFPIDMIWLDEKRRVVHVLEAVPPCRKEPCASYVPMQRAVYVVELNARQARREQVVLGAVLDFTLPR